MKQFNLHATHKSQISVSVIKQYAVVLSVLVITLTGYTYYTMYILRKQVHDMPAQTKPEPTDPQRDQPSALHHFVQVLEYLPKELTLTSITVTQVSISLKGMLKNKHSFSTFLKKIAPHYTIMQAKTTTGAIGENTAFTIELKTA